MSTTPSPSTGPAQQQPIAKPWVGQLKHSRQLADDWGFIRDETGRLIITVPVTISEAEMAVHRLNKTDPTQPIVDALLAALNAPAKT